MIVPCPFCGQKNRLPATLVVTPTTRVRCGRCKHSLDVITCDACDAPGPVDADGYCAECAAEADANGDGDQL